MAIHSSFYNRFSCLDKSIARLTHSKNLTTTPSCTVLTTCTILFPSTCLFLSNAAVQQHFQSYKISFTTDYILRPTLVTAGNTHSLEALSLCAGSNIIMHGEAVVTTVVHNNL